MTAANTVFENRTRILGVFARLAHFLLSPRRDAHLPLEPYEERYNEREFLRERMMGNPDGFNSDLDLHCVEPLFARGGPF